MTHNVSGVYSLTLGDKIYCQPLIEKRSCLCGCGFGLLASPEKPPIQCKGMFSSDDSELDSSGSGSAPFVGALMATGSQVGSESKVCCGGGPRACGPPAMCWAWQQLIICYL